MAFLFVKVQVSNADFPPFFVAAKHAKMRFEN